LTAFPTIYMPGQAAVPRGPREHPGRKTRTTAAGWVLDYLVPRNHTVLLCQQCNHKFNGKRVKYICLLQRLGYVRGMCDGCKKPWELGYLWVSERHIGTRSGQCWDPKFL